MIPGLSRLGPAARLSIGVISLMVFLLLMLELFIGLGAGRLEDAARVRASLAERIALQAGGMVEHGRQASFARLFDDTAVRNPELLSMALRTHDGRIVAQAGPHDSHWTLPADAPSSITQVRVPMFANQVRWGDVELSFAPIHPQSLRGWLQERSVIAALLFVVLGTLIVFLFLRRALQYLDPSAVVPQRVRAALDTLTEGIVLLDADGRIVIANRSFLSLPTVRGESLIGKPVDSLEWMVVALGEERTEWPWIRAEQTRQSVEDTQLTIPLETPGETLDLLLNAAPVLDEERRYRGCMLSVSDVTDIHRTNEELRRTVAALDASHATITQQNAELRRLATTDPLTGCLNRRAFYERLSAAISSARRSRAPMGCIMTDIDFFKRFNDTYGHAVGDQVLIIVSRILGEGVREADILARFGGEEFCIVLPDQDLTACAAVAERLRARIEQDAGKEIEASEPIRITSSFGVATLDPDKPDGEEMIQRADEALYKAKHLGRNQVATERDVAESGVDA